MKNISPAPGIVYGVSYGLVARLLAEVAAFVPVMSLSFLFLVPFVMGYLTITTCKAPRFATKLFLPWLTIIVTILLVWLGSLEDTIYIVMAAPVLLIFASMGGIATGLGNWHARGVILPVVLLLPQLTSLMEDRLDLPDEIMTVRTSVQIDAPREVVWENIKRIRKFEKWEEQTSIYHMIGFPSPIEATLSMEGIGGIRHASFERTLSFVETITNWEEFEQIEFRIEIDPDKAEISPLKNHVTIGGTYFDTLTGVYWIEKKGGVIILHLDSKHRLSTRFNFYAGLWTNSLVSHVQEYILNVIKKRCEKVT